jgi:hypothetical protein
MSLRSVTTLVLIGLLLTSAAAARSRACSAGRIEAASLRHSSDSAIPSASICACCTGADESDPSAADIDQGAPGACCCIAMSRSCEPEGPGDSCTCADGSLVAISGAGRLLKVSVDDVGSPAAMSPHHAPRAFLAPALPTRSIDGRALARDLRAVICIRTI